jgi:hypothetical protein
MELKKHPLILLLLIAIYSLIVASSFALFMPNDCCKQPNGASHCSCNPNAHINQFPCGNVLNEYPLSEPSVVYETVSKHLYKSQVEKTGITSENVTTVKPKPVSYVEFTMSLPGNRLYYGWSQYRSPPFICA